MMIKVLHTDCQFYAHVKASWKESIARNITEVQKSEILFLNPRWHCQSHWLLDIRHFHVEPILDIKDLIIFC